MEKPYKTILESAEDEFVEKKSRFIANLKPVESEEEATAFIAEMKKKYWDARSKLLEAETDETKASTSSSTTASSTEGSSTESSSSTTASSTESSDHKE